MARFDTFLRLVVDQGASDLHFHAGNVPIIRHHNDLVELPFRKLTEAETRRFLIEIMTKEQKEELDADQNVDFIYVMEGVARFRANIFMQRHGLGAVFRVIPEKLPSLEELMMPPSIRKLTKTANGIVLVTGPTGSGKTTTLAAMIRDINETSRRHIITVEDPIEFIHTPVKSVITQRQVGAHTESFAAALRSALREAPDVLVVGELRDLETMNLALSAAESHYRCFARRSEGSDARRFVGIAKRSYRTAPLQTRQRGRTRCHAGDIASELGNFKHDQRKQDLSNRGLFAIDQYSDNGNAIYGDECSPSRS